MLYYKIINGNYINAIGTGSCSTDITKEEYDQIYAVIQAKPAETDETGYRLKTDLTWETYEKPAPDPDPDATDEEILEAIGGAL